MANALKSGESVGISRFLCASEVACLAAISHGVIHLYAISKTYNAPQATIHRALQRLEQAQLIEPHGGLEGSFEMVYGHARKTYKLTETGNELLSIMRKPGADKALAYYDPLFEDIK